MPGVHKSHPYLAMLLGESIECDQNARADQDFYIGSARVFPDSPSPADLFYDWYLNTKSYRRYEDRAKAQENRVMIIGRRSIAQLPSGDIQGSDGNVGYDICEDEEDEEDEEDGEGEEGEEGQEGEDLHCVSVSAYLESHLPYTNWTWFRPFAVIISYSTRCWWWWQRLVLNSNQVFVLRKVILDAPKQLGIPFEIFYERVLRRGWSIHAEPIDHPQFTTQMMHPDDSFLRLIYVWICECVLSKIN